MAKCRLDQLTLAFYALHLLCLYYVVGSLFVTNFDDSQISIVTEATEPLIEMRAKPVDGGFGTPWELSPWELSEVCLGSWLLPA